MGTAEWTDRICQAHGRPTKRSCWDSTARLRLRRPPDKTPRPAWSWTKPLALDVLEVQFVRTAELLRAGKIEGFIILQKRLAGSRDPPPQIQWTKNYLDWLFQTANRSRLSDCC